MKLSAINGLKKNKSCGKDQIINEYFKATSSLIIPLITNLFNVILNSGSIPSDWGIGIIKPIYKNKDDPTKPEYYRGITVLSCFGKLFTAVVNKRLTKYLDANRILGEEQAGFRQNYSTVDHIYVLKCIIDIYTQKNKKIFLLFVDYSTAFDKIKRTLLWSKLLKCGINGKIFNVIYNLYSNVQSCIEYNGFLSPNFDCNTGVRQGENLSPLLYAIYVNDLSDALWKDIRGLQYIGKLAQKSGLEKSELLCKLFLLLYADDTVIIGETQQELQTTINILYEYCDMNNLSLNTSKTKVMVCSKGKIRNIPQFKYGTYDLQVVYEYVYLGVKLSYNGKFKEHMLYAAAKGTKAMFGLLQKSRMLNLPTDINVHLFDSVISPVLLYGCEAWANNDPKIIEQIHLKFCKYILCVNKNSSNTMIYGELGRSPMQVTILTRTLTYWAQLVTAQNENKFNVIMFNLMYELFLKKEFTSPWIKLVKDTLENLGYNYIWQGQYVDNVELFKIKIKQRLTDQYKQQWEASLYESSKCSFYKTINNDLRMQQYLLTLPFSQRKIMTRFRVSNHRLPVELLRYTGIDREQRVCHKCNENIIGDEIH